MTRNITFAQACAQWPGRFTMEHVPNWAKLPHLHKDGEFQGQSLYYAPQYRSDAEWYENTTFPGEKGIDLDDNCHCINQSWPLGNWLIERYVKGQIVGANPKPSIRVDSLLEILCDIIPYAESRIEDMADELGKLEGKQYDEAQALYAIAYERLERAQAFLNS